MINTRRNKRLAGATLGLGLAMLAGCSQMNQLLGREESVDYRSTVAGDPLSIPPDLTQANANAQYRAPEGAATFSQYAQKQQQAQSASDADRVLPQQEGIQVVRDGNLRWLVVDQPADKVYAQVLEFWGEQGFTIHSQDPRAGLLETDWAENRAKIPEGWIKSALGGILDQVFDSGERERFRTRLERVGGKTEIYISHDQMIETESGDRTGWKWVEGKEDPGLNAAMLARLMVFLGTDVDTARAKVEQAERNPDAVQTEQAPEGIAALRLNEPFDRAWRRVGVALDSAGFSMEDRDRSAGDYYVRYLDTDTGQKIEQPNFFSRLFGGKGTSEARVYRIHVTEQGGGSIVTVLTQDGQQDNSETAQRIISVLNDSMP